MNNIKTIGALLIGFSAVLLVILAYVKTDFESQSAFGIGFLMLGGGAYMFFFYKSSAAEKKGSFKEIDKSKLDEEESRIYNIIKSKEGSAYQSDLIKETGFSKVKITRILDKLETSDILERKRRGMTNIVVLK